MERKFSIPYKVIIGGWGQSQRRHWHPTPVLLPGKSHGWRSLVCCSPWGCEESDMTERLHVHFSLSCIGEGNGNLLQCSCLENPRDVGAWWAAICGVTQSWTRLKWLSSSSRGQSVYLRKPFFIIIKYNQRFSKLYYLHLKITPNFHFLKMIKILLDTERTQWFLVVFR